MRGRLNKDMLTAIQKSFDSNIGVEVKMILVPEDYHKAIQRDSEFLEILDANVSYTDCSIKLSKSIGSIGNMIHYYKLQPKIDKAKGLL